MRAMMERLSAFLARRRWLVVGAWLLVLAVSEGLRKKVLDALFGAEEEFEYTSTTSSPAGERAGAVG